MPTAAATTTRYLSLADAVPVLEQLTGLRLDYDVLRKRLKRAHDLPAVVDRIYLRRWGRDADHLREEDLPLWAAWLKENM